MKSAKPILIILAAVVIGILTLRVLQITTGATEKRLSRDEYFNTLLARSRQSDLSIPERRDLAREIDRLGKRMGKLKKEQAENPSDFFEALALLKTNARGETYPPGYKEAEIRRARRRPALTKGARTLQAVWTSRGPTNVGGRARAMAIDPSDASGDTWWVASVGGGVWNTTDAGNSWAMKTPVFTSLSTTTIAICTYAPDIMYVGTGMGYGRILDLSGSGIWKSGDHGETWQQLSSTANGELLQAINRIIVDPANPDLVLVCSNDTESYNTPKPSPRRSGIFRSTDGGGTWTLVFDPDEVLGTATDNRVQQLLSNPSNFDIIYATLNEVGVIKSTDRGLTWQVVADNFAQPGYIGTGGNEYRGISTRIELAISPTDTTRLYAAVERHREPADLYMSKDAGQTWEIVTDTGLDPDWFNWYGDPNGYQAGWFDNTILIHPFDPNIVFVGGVNMYRIEVDPELSQRTTTRIVGGGTGGWMHVDQHYLAAIIDDRETQQFRLVCANDGGVAYSPDGGINWEQLSGMVTSQFYGVDKKPGEDAYLGGMQDNGTRFSSLNSTTWLWATGGDGVEVVWNNANPTLMLSGSQYGQFYRSEDGGATWSNFDSPPLSYFPFITKYGHTKSDPHRIYTIGFDGLARSDFFGEDWSVTPLGYHWHGLRAFDNVEVSHADPRVVWLTSRMAHDANAGRGGGIHVSVDGGHTLIDITANFPSSVVEASGLATDPHDPNTAYFLFAAPDAPKILKTDDLGQTFQDLSGFNIGATESTNGFPDAAVFDLVVMPFDANVMWAGTEIGLFISTDGGATWAYEATDMGHVSIFQMKIVDDQVVIGTYGRGIWTARLAELAGYTHPQITLMPGLRKVYQSPAGDMVLDIDLRSPYDSANIKMDGVVVHTFAANSGQQSFQWTRAVTSPLSTSIVIESTRDGEDYLSSRQDAQLVPLIPVPSYLSDFSDPTDIGDFTGTGFAIDQPDGFSNPALHTPHPYPGNTNLVFRLTNSIQVAATDATIEFDEIVVVEIGMTELWDYVTVEGSRDGLNWIPLVDGYDSGVNQTWADAYNSSGTYPVTDELYFHRSIDLHSHFSIGENVFIRFKLYADGGVEAWGWAIDNLSIQGGTFSLQPGSGLPDRFHLYQNYPNPFNMSTTLQYALPRRAQGSLKVYTLLGREVVTLKQDWMDRGFHEVRWNGRDKLDRAVASGIYFAVFAAEGKLSTRKMVMLK